MNNIFINTATPSSIVDVWNLIITFIGAIIVPMALAYFGYRIFWPQFKKQTRINNICQNAKEALGYLISIEDLLRRLILLQGKTESNSYKNHDYDHINLHDNLLCEIGKLQNSLLLISKDEDLQENTIILTMIMWIEKLGKILDGDNKKLPKSFTSIDFLSELDLFEGDLSQIKLRFNELRNALVATYQISTPCKKAKYNK